MGGLGTWLCLPKRGLRRLTGPLLFPGREGLFPGREGGEPLPRRVGNATALLSSRPLRGYPCGMEIPSLGIAPSLAAATIDDLRRHAPFDRMDRACLDWLVARLSVVYFAPGTDVLTPAASAPEHLYIVKQGAVLGFGSDQAPGEQPRWRLSVGECSASAPCSGSDR